MKHVFLSGFLAILGSSVFGQVTYLPNDTLLSGNYTNSIVAGYGNFNDYQGRNGGTSPTITIAAGSSIPFLSAASGSKVNATLTSFGGFDASETSKSILNGGTVNGYTRLYDQAILKVYGSHFNNIILLQSPGTTLEFYGGSSSSYIFLGQGLGRFYGNLTATFQYQQFGERYYYLNGTDALGNQIRNLEFGTYPGGRYEILPGAVPEPATLFALSAGALAMALKRRRRKI
jgi:hypothetical protein